MASKNKVRDCARKYVKNCVDTKTGEVNTTLLAEQIAEELNLYIGSNFDIPEYVFEIAGEFCYVK